MSQKAYDLGYAATSILDNPYARGGSSYRSWEEGYFDGARARKKSGGDIIPPLAAWDKHLSGKKKKNSSGGYQSCYHTHPPLPLPDGTVIYGGSCLNPVVKDADIYVGFDSGHRSTKGAYPWEGKYDFLFYIQDMGVPDSSEDFKKLVSWVKEQLEAGKKVHVGCIGGHGRTGTFLSALVSLYGITDAIQYVRKNYCKKAVESSKQVEFLQEHFGVSSAEGTKSSLLSSNYGVPSKLSSRFDDNWSQEYGQNDRSVIDYVNGGHRRTSVDFNKNRPCIWD